MPDPKLASPAVESLADPVHTDPDPGPRSPAAGTGSAKPYVPAFEFRKAIGMSKSAMETRLKRGDLVPHHVTPGGRRFFSQEQIAEWKGKDWRAKTGRKKGKKLVRKPDAPLAGYLSVVEFAALVGESPATLRRYHRLGLFVPAVTTEGGWRYYTQAQVDEYLSGSAAPRQAEEPEAAPGPAEADG